MTKNTITTKPITAGGVFAARLSFAAAAAFLILLVTLHFIEPEFDPSWHMISEYEIGRYGWVMQLAFLCLGLSCVSLVVAIRSQVGTIGGWIGLALLLISASGLTIAAFYITDPMIAPKTEMTWHGNMHGLGFTLGAPGLAVASVLISLSLRHNQAWILGRRLLMWIAQLPWLSLIATLATILILLPRNGGKFGPGVVVGLPNRLFVIACCVWLMTVAWRRIRLRGQKA